MRGASRIAVICAVALAAGPAAGGETVSSRSKSALFQSQLKVLDGRAAQQYSNSVRLQPPRAIVPGSPQARALSRGADSPFYDTALAAARRHGVPEQIFLALVAQESGWNPGAVSPKGAIGLAQLMPATARLLRVDPRRPSQNLDGGARYLRDMFNRFGTWRLALAAYNAGPEAVQRHGGVPPYAETRAYVAAILP